MSKEQDAVFFRNFALVLVVLTCFGIFAAIMGRYFGALAQHGQFGQKPETVEQRVAPVGEVNTEPVPAVVTATLAPTPAAAGSPVDNGRKTYESVCVACHGMGVAGAPKFGDKEAWAPRIGQGKDTLYQHAIGGFQGKGGMMPPKGGNAALTDDDVKATVDYMVASSGGPAALAAAPAQPAVAPEATAAVPATEPAATAAAAGAALTAAGIATEAGATASAGGDVAKGKQVFESVCFVCHATGVAGAPKFGNKDDWAARIAQGMDVLVQHATQGFMGKKGVMPPKGGRADLADDDIKATVQYMVEAAK